MNSRLFDYVFYLTPINQTTGAEIIQRITPNLPIALVRAHNATSMCVHSRICVSLSNYYGVLYVSKVSDSDHKAAWSTTLVPELYQHY